MHKMTLFLVCRQLLWLTFSLSLLIFSAGVSWQLSKSANFFYDVWYQTLDINDVVVKHVPKNTQGKRDFPRNDTSLHSQKFADIVGAIHQQGDGLTTISYVNKQGLSQKLLTKSEVQHLQDVANLIDSLKTLWWLNLLLLIAFIYFYCAKCVLQSRYKALAIILRIPNVKQKLFAITVLALLIVISFISWGFTEIFYYLHTVVFPENHQWFFYYNDSLMATLMKAPDIFAAIAIQLTFITLIVAAFMDMFITRFQARNKPLFTQTG